MAVLVDHSFGRPVLVDPFLECQLSHEMSLSVKTGSGPTSWSQSIEMLVVRMHAAVRYSARCWEAVPALDGAQPVEDNVRAAGAGVTRGELPHTERWDMVR
jgi:hypothetical protein